MLMWLHTYTLKCVRTLARRLSAQPSSGTLGSILVYAASNLVLRKACTRRIGLKSVTTKENTKTLWVSSNALSGHNMHTKTSVTNTHSSTVRSQAVMTEKMQVYTYNVHERYVIFTSLFSKLMSHCILLWKTKTQKQNKMTA